MSQWLNVQLVKVQPVMLSFAMSQPVKRTPAKWLDDQFAFLKVTDEKLLPSKRLDAMVIRSRSRPA